MATTEGGPTTVGFSDIFTTTDQSYEGRDTEANESTETFSFVCNIIVTPILCFLGLIGNSLGVGVLWKDNRRQKLSIYFYLCALTFFDSIYLGIGLIRTIPGIVQFYDEELSTFLESHMNLGFIYADMCFTHTSLLLIIIMSIERLLALSRPLKVKDTIFAKYPKTIIICCFLYNAIFLLPYAIYFEVKSYESENLTQHYIQFQEYIVEDMDVYMKIQTVLDYFIPVTITGLINIAIPIQYYRITKKRQVTLNLQSTSSSNHQIKITLTVFIVTLLYLLLCIPNVIIKILAFINKDYSFDGEKRAIFWLFIDISNLFAYINAANDFLIYVLVSDVYRQVFKSMYCKVCCREKHSQRFVSESLPYNISGTLSTGDMQSF